MYNYSFIIAMNGTRMALSWKLMIKISSKFPDQVALVLKMLVPVVLGHTSALPLTSMAELSALRLCLKWQVINKINMNLVLFSDLFVINISIVLVLNMVCIITF